MECSPNDVKEALGALCSAERPLIIAGGGVIQANASKQLIEFAHLLNIPVVCSMMGLEVFPQMMKIMPV